MAVIQACEDIIAQCKQRAALTWDLDEEQVDWVDGEAVPKPGVNADVKPLSLADIARGAGRTGGPVLGRASLNAQGAGASFSCNFTDAKVDKETGKVDILSFTAVQDAGRAIHPSYVEGQMLTRRRAGPRLGVERGVHLRRRRRHGEPRLPGLPRAGGLGHADDRHPDHRSAQPVPPLRRARRRRDPDHGPAGGAVQRRPRPARIPHRRPAAVAPEGAGGDRRERGGASSPPSDPPGRRHRFGSGGSYAALALAALWVLSAGVSEAQTEGHEACEALEENTTCRGICERWFQSSNPWSDAELVSRAGACWNNHERWEDYTPVEVVVVTGTSVPEPDPVVPPPTTAVCSFSGMVVSRPEECPEFNRRHCRLRFTEQCLLLWMSRVG